MRLNMLSPAKGSRPTRRRVGRGIGCGFGKTCGRGHKGQRSRAGGYHKVGFEGGQMPMQRRLPKLGFASRLARKTAEIRLHELGKITADVIDLDSLKKAKIIARRYNRARIIDTGKLDRAITVRGLGVTKGARRTIEAAGGTIEA